MNNNLEKTEKDKITIQKKDYKETEKDIWTFWEKEKLFSYNKEDKKPIFSVDTPPPTVSGRMHIGHAYGYTIADFIVRYYRKKGYNIFYPFGLDDNGIPTELLAEKNAKVRAKDLEKSEFVKICLENTKKAEELIIDDFKSLGLSCDWDLLYRTISPEVIKVSQYSFLDLYKKNKVYLEKGPILWCTNCQTAISQAELEDIEKDTYFNDLIFKLENGKEIIIATTRPEFLPACVAIFVNPDDNRYKELIGKKAQVPLFNHWVKIYSDNRVAIDKGTGIVMCCTFGDQTDMEWYKSYKLELKEAISKHGRMTSICGKYENMKILDARKEIIEDLKKENLLINQKPLKHIVNCHERCGTAVEIIVTDQWYVNYLDDKDYFITEAEKINWVPRYMKVRYDNWVKNLQWNWCISRQRYSGVPFPVWYCKNCGKPIFAEYEDLPIYPEETQPNKNCDCGCNEFIPDKNIMDTWSTSALTPLINMGWPEKDTSKSIPMSFRPQGHDIITLWAFNTIVKSLYHTNKLPWNNLLVHGHVLDSQGNKMSKSKGNGIDPIKVVDNFGKDPFRYWCAQVTLGEDIPYSEQELLAGKKMIVKLINSMNFVELVLKDFESIPNIESKNFIDLWILNKLYKITNDNNLDMQKYDYTHTIQRLRDFFYIDFCDNYLEFIKYRFYNGSKEEKEELANTIYKISFEIINQLSIFLPFVCEDVYKRLFEKYNNEKSICFVPIQEYDNINLDYIKKGEDFKEIISYIRKYKSQNQLSMKEPIKEITIEGNYSLDNNEKEAINKILFVENIIIKN